MVKTAFFAVREGYSPDRVVADPELHALFLRKCASLGATDSVAVLNRRLLNLRKASQLTGLQSRKTSFPDQEEYLFASEIAVRFLERRDGLTLDDVICDPVRVAEFDELAARIAPGYRPLQYRWAALWLRKNRCLRPEPIGRAIPPISVGQARANEINLGDVPGTQGLYIVCSGAECLYVGEARNLRSRLKKHLDHSDNRGLARWLWERGAEQVHLEWQVLPPATPTRTRRAMECELIRSRRPLFNVMYSENQFRTARGGTGS